LAKARISDIETGKISNPHAKTVDALCVALNISREERGACHPDATSRLPPRLLENLALRFGHDNPNAGEDELEAFLKDKAKEFREMHERLAQMAEADHRISNLLTAANAALEEGDFTSADNFLEEAECFQHSTTIVVLEKQAKLRLERGNAALMSGDVTAGCNHFERSALYFVGIDRTMEATHRDNYASLLRYYAYRYKSHEALYAARSALEQNFHIWRIDAHAEQWCKTKLALGGVSLRLSQFDSPGNSLAHLADSKRHLEDVRDFCSESFLPYCFARAGLDLATVCYQRLLAKSDGEFEKNLETALSLQKSVLFFWSNFEDRTPWGVLQHNMGRSYTLLSELRSNETKSINDLENAIRHFELSFQVRDPEHSLQYWVASCRSLGEALLNISKYSITKNRDEYIRRASEILKGAAARISESEHPNQWAEIQEQLARCGEQRLLLSGRLPADAFAMTATGPN
jgi:hypothetical protein